ncbi:DUF4375 domain-containing protein [Mesorhizobium sp. B1-1-4]|uniref:DMP19 family protein n=1 Tax=unclassified Mesorhizobium TaxID=325217 RepID=UPI00112C94C8|nr:MULTISPECIES: DUF4375 domain-containing protein [unclassified Mesorhizobium]MBZ9917289.1 DMP19 family protein [Mesorhizobium sp. BR1-1-7]MBZ9969081.1 DMP19 family protein [Mesorhizobium sp. BR1-1-12]TPL99281.1 DUF4375 domain-containing protein [Mesorhizobium sp. B2-3-8]TPM12182.1 DUF4375 domain-containing protein [Mesorhizobium sp. B2-3-7]TPN14695.1 DUF4375 domain-containing protein [Mesorhizobium sp. B2-1-3]
MKAFSMFGFFFRKSRKTSEKLASNAARWPQVRLPLPVFVRRSTVEQAIDSPSELVFAVEIFIQTMTYEGLYRYPEISPRAMQVSHANSYSAEVKNGGHSQFIYNGAEETNAMITNARVGLAASGASGQLATLEKMSSWIAEHPDEAAEQTGFEGGCDDFLDALDGEFYHADEAAPMQGFLARWIVSWPDLQIVEDDDYSDVIHGLVMANPQREARLLHRSISKLVRQMIGWRDVGAGLACAKVSPPEVRLGFGMARMLDVGGEMQMVFQLRTSAKEPRLCVATETHADIYEYIAAEDPPVIRPGENSLGAIAPRVGNRLGHAEGSEIKMVVELAEQYHAPAAVDLLLRKAGFDPTDAIVSANSIVQTAEGVVVNWVVLASDRAFLLLSSWNGSVLLRGKDNEKLADATIPELAEHFDRSAAAG